VLLAAGAHHYTYHTAVCVKTRHSSAVCRQVLPDLTGWDYGGDVAIDGKKANVWQYQHKEEDKVRRSAACSAMNWSVLGCLNHVPVAAQVSQYTFYVSESGEPLQFLMMGRSPAPLTPLCMPASVVHNL
jgi:hypothetical protein